MSSSSVDQGAPQHFSDRLSDRFVDFGVRMVRLAHAVDRTSIGKPLTAQIVRCGTSCGANYEEARAAESKRDFTHKLGIVLKELRECRYWILLVSKAQLVRPNRVAPLLDECEQLCAIIGKSLVTARGRRRNEE